MTISTGKRLIAKNSIINLLGQIAPMLVGLLTIPYIVKGLGDNGYGILSVAFMVLGYFSIFDLGLSRATVKFVAEHLSPEQSHKIPGLVWTSLALLVALGSFCGALAAAFVPLAVTHFFKMPPSFVGETQTSLFILCASMPIILANDSLRGVLEATQRFDLVNYVKLPGSICFYLFAALAIPFGVTVHVIVLILVMVRLVTTGAYLLFCFRAIPILRSSFRISRESIRPLTAFGGWIMVSNITGPIFGNIERFLIASILSVGALTYYSVPFDLVGKILIFPSSIAPALFPYFSFHSSRSRNQVADVSARSLKYLIVVMTPTTSVFFFFAKDILQIWLGPQFAKESAGVMQIVAFLFFFNSIAYIPYASVQALGRPELKALLDVASLPLYALLSWWLMRHMGINGAALAKFLVTVLDCGLLYFFAWRINAFRFTSLFSGSLSRALLASGSFFALTYLIHAIHFNITVSSVLLTLSFLGYGIAFWFLATDTQEREILKSFSSKVLVRRTEAAEV